VYNHDSQILWGKINKEPNMIPPVSSLLVLPWLLHWLFAGCWKNLDLAILGSSYFFKEPEVL
jgi:hypothetical protein